ncbi:hypothetical protein CHS0354_040498 [Potamilus streckersoni]|uniref:Beta-lactamase-related domain-containing protein n=1 Tax=Potamilus streckersoni TaxID=2493646 RepID=A0AAE0TK16_9BIVA|nr:hypothetical protein CHS0354_040498 [Potamilus streckersoni]
MYMLKHVIMVVVMAGVINYIPSLFKSKLPPIVEGFFQPEFIQVAETFRSNLESGKENGGAFSVYYKGKVLVDMWAGYADIEAARRWRNNTISLIFSSTKGLAAIVVALMGGLIILDEPLYTRELVTDPKKVENVLARQETKWPAGTSLGYHGITYGLYVDRLVSKADPKQRSMEQIFREEIAEPFGIDIYMNAPRGEFYRIAREHFAPTWKMLLMCFQSPKYFKVIGNYLLFPSSLFGRSIRALKEFTEINSMNNPEIREITVSAYSATGTARGLAKLYGILANGGTYQGKQLLSKEVIEKLSTTVIEGFDVVTQVDGVKYGQGVHMKLNPWGQTVYGHTGHGGQVAMADPSNDLGIAYITNFISIYGMGDDPRYLDLEKAAYEGLRKYQARREKS